MKHRLIFWLVMYLLGCKDKPYQETLLKEEIQADQPTHNIQGVVEVGIPVAGASVAAYSFSGLRRGEKMAETTSDDKGVFNLAIKNNYQGPLLLVASGGSYRDLMTEEIVFIKPEQELRSVTNDVTTQENNHINAWTTLAVARVQATKGFWDSSVAKLDDKNRIDVDFSHISSFLKVASPNSINIRRQGLLDINNEPIHLDDPRTALFLTQAGLSQLANKYQRLTGIGTTITIIHVVDALAQDMSDRLFDGKNAQGERVFVDPSHMVNLSSYTLRKELAEAIFHYGKRLKDKGKLSQNDLVELTSSGRLLNLIAEDARPEFFPEAERPLPIDITAPNIRVSFTGKYAQERQFSILDGDVYMKAIIEEDSSAVEIAVIAPEIPKTTEENTYGPISNQHKQNAIEAAIACNQRKEFEAMLQQTSSRQEDAFCACFEARDVSGNVEQELSCFLRARPIAQISAPMNQAVLLRQHLVNGLHIRGMARSGAALSTCYWAIYGYASSMVTDALLLRGEGNIIGTQCQIDHYADVNQLTNGRYLLVIRAEDNASRKLDDFSVNFNIRRDMVRLPDRIIGPLPN